MAAALEGKISCKGKESSVNSHDFSTIFTAFSFKSVWTKITENVTFTKKTQPFESILRFIITLSETQGQRTRIIHLQN